MARATRIALDLALASSKELKSKLPIVWRYAKIELAPPMTISFLHGPIARKLEGIASNTADSLITGINKTIREIDAKEERQRKEKAAALKMAIERAKAEEKKRADENKKDVDKLEKASKQSEKPKEKTEQPKETSKQK